MKSVFERETRDELRRRMEGIAPDARPRWGKMNAGQMLAHVNASLRMALGELPCAPKKSPLTNPFLRWLVINVLPWPRGTPTAPELLATAPAEWNAEVAAFADLLERLGARSGSATWPRHPVFGQLGAKLWGNLSFRHTDHHLRQFGV